MPFEVTDNLTGKTISFDNKPTNQDITEAFGQLQEQPKIEQPQEDEGYFERIRQKLSERASKIGSIYERKGFAKLPETLALGSGQVAGGLSDIFAESAVSAYKTFVPEHWQEDLKGRFKEIAKTGFGQAALAALSKGQEEWGDFKRAYPKAAEAVEAGADLAQFGIIKKGTKVGAKVAGEAIKEPVLTIADIGQETILKKSIPFIDNKMSKVVEKGISKSIRPAAKNLGKTAYSQNKYFKQAKEGIERIIENKSNLSFVDEAGEAIEGQLPETIKQFGEAIGQTKRELFNEYSKITLGKKGIKVDTRPVARELMKLARNKHIQDRYPKLIEKIRDRALAYYKRSQKAPYDVMEAQDAIAKFNRSLDSFYRNPTYEAATDAGVDAIVADVLRKQLTRSINDSGYDQLKHAYGALLAIEDDVMRSASTNLQAGSKGLIDFSDVFSVYAGIRGVLRGDPSTIAAAGGATVAKHYIKFWNNPNYVIKNMFKDAENLKIIKDFKRAPRSKLFKLFMRQKIRPTTEIMPKE